MCYYRVLELDLMVQYKRLPRTHFRFPEEVLVTCYRKPSKIQQGMASLKFPVDYKQFLGYFLITLFEMIYFAFLFFFFVCFIRRISPNLTVFRINDFNKLNDQSKSKGLFSFVPSLMLSQLL